MPLSDPVETRAVFFDLQDTWLNFLQQLPLIAIGMLCFVIIFYLSKPLTRLTMRPLRYLSKSKLIQLVVRRSIRLVLVLLGLYIFLRFAGLTEFAVAILSGTGMVGLILGFAFRDIAENFISSLLLSIQKPFKIGDVIDVEGQIGVVKQVTARATTLVDFDGDHIQIPNATIYKNIIRNITANPLSRGKFIIGVGYDSSVVVAQSLALNVLNNAAAVVDDPEPQVLVDSLGSSTVNLKVYYWIDAHQHSLLKVSSVLMRTIMRELEKNGISMPDDAREIIFPQGIHVKTQIEQLSSNETKKPSTSTPLVNNESIDTKDASNQDVDDVSSDVEDIREQARSARDTERGDNII